MPHLPLRSCLQPGCATLVQSGKCAEHAQMAERRREKTTARGYDAKHQKLRILCFQRDDWRCVDCGWQAELVSDFHRFGLGEPPAAKVLEELRMNFNRGERHLHADHDIPIQVRPELRLDLDNLRTRCDKCHRVKTLREFKQGILSSQERAEGGALSASSPRAI